MSGFNPLDLSSYQGIGGAPGQGPTWQELLAAAGQAPQGPPLGQPGPQAPAPGQQPQQWPPQAGPSVPPQTQKPGILQALKNNPQLLQSLGQILMAKAGGKYGGIMAQGAQQGQQQRTMNQMQQQQLNQQGQLQQAQIGNMASQEQARKAAEYRQDLNDLFQYTVKYGQNVADSAGLFHMQLDPQTVDRLQKGVDAFKAQQDVYLDGNTESPTYGQPVPADPNDTNQVKTNKTDAPKVQAVMLKKIPPTQSLFTFHIDEDSNADGYVVPKEYVDQMAKKTGQTWEEMGFGPAVPQPIAIDEWKQKNQPTKAPTDEIQLGYIASNPMKAGKPIYQPDDVASAKSALKTIAAQKQAEAANTPTGQIQGETEQALQRAAVLLASGNMSPIGQITSFRNDEKLRLFDKITQINPNFNTAELDRKIKMMADVQTGNTSQQIQSFGTFLEHAGEAQTALNNVYQSQTPLWNNSLNWWKKNMSGDPNYQAYIAALEPVRKEFEGFLLGGKALYGDDRKAAEKLLSDNASPGQQNAALKQLGKTAEARYNEINYRYKKVMGNDIGSGPGELPPFSPEAMQAAQRIGVTLPTGRQQAPTGQAPRTGQTGAQPGYKFTATGQGGHKIGSNDGTTWFDVQTGQPIR